MSTRTDLMKHVVSFYRFFEISGPKDVREELIELGDRLGLKGTILIGAEGLNSTVTGKKESLEEMVRWLENRFGDFHFKWSLAEGINEVFFRFKVKLKKEIVTMGVQGLRMENSGKHVGYAEWNELLLDPDVIVIDARNDYETDIGTFPGSVLPGINNFREFPDWVGDELDPKEHKKVAMFCTGGIRCEKASAYMINQGFESVYQLDGGILKYLETVDQKKNKWDGECFVFDQRVSVNSVLEQGRYSQCFACRHPLDEAELDAPEYEEGVSCAYCVDDKSLERREQFRQRQKQIGLANQRGERHLGVSQ